MSAAKRQKMSDGSAASFVPAGRGLLCISLDSQSVEDALQAMAGGCCLAPSGAANSRSLGGRGLSAAVLCCAVLCCECRSGDGRDPHGSDVPRREAGWLQEDLLEVCAVSVDP